MKTLTSFLALVGLVHAGLTVTSNGVTYTVTHTKDGVELPVVPGPQLDIGSRRLEKAKAKRLGRVQKRDQVSSNWCGVVNQNAPGGTWNSVTGSWTVPQISLRQGQSPDDQPSIAQWVGIDGDGCGTGLIQGGTLSQLTTSGSQENYAWFEFVPNPLSTFQMTVNTGDSMSGYVTATGTNTGNITVTNDSNGESMNMEITDGPGTLCGYSAEWIFEDLSGGNGLLPFAEFPSNEFTGCSATTTSGGSGGPGGGSAIDLAGNGQTLCVGSAQGSSVEIESTA